jgi:tetratricopeptide (TPR) repeat protein
MYNVQRARALLMRARCRVAQHQIPEAQRDLDDAWQLLAPLAESSMFAGVQGSLANWWEVTARIRTASRDLAGAAEALGKAVEFRRIVSQLPQLEGPQKFFWLANTLQDYSAALEAVGNPDAAMKAFDESRVIYLKIGTV